MPRDAVIEGVLEHPAIIGKLPGHGDFIARGVAYRARDQFDLWLSEWMKAGREAHGEDFEAVYEVAAPWLIETTARTAILMPSMDSVGRLYPILAITDPDCLTQSIYDCLVGALQDGTKSDDLREALDGLARSERVPAAEGWFLPEGAEASLPSPDTVPEWSAIGEIMV
ncbi:type VI secretion system-associated protein TagF [Erythrobacter sp. GH1-10]|uniref:type VI secretion system-associated protein TagF n=1 Tax=Erythrobacter sp. GH1-10 TaxID=3349334 RepID=UPI0038782C76